MLRDECWKLWILNKHADRLIPSYILLSRKAAAWASSVTLQEAHVYIYIYECITGLFRGEAAQFASVFFRRCEAPLREQHSRGIRSLGSSFFLGQNWPPFKWRYEVFQIQKKHPSGMAWQMPVMDDWCQGFLFRGQRILWLDCMSIYNSVVVLRTNHKHVCMFASSIYLAVTN